MNVCAVFVETAGVERLVALGAVPETAPDPTCSPGEVLAVVRAPDGNPVGPLSPGPGTAQR